MANKNTIQRRRTRRNRRIRIIVEGGGRCWYCGNPVQIGSATIDHKVPRAQGGTDDTSNLVACCFECNQRKGGRTVSEYKSFLRYDARGIEPNPTPIMFWGERNQTNG